jgi:hypothetical protein
MWLLGRLAPDHKTIADFRKGNGGAATCFPQRRPERQIERMIQRLFTKAIR